MCVVCGDISSTQATASLLPTFLVATSPLVMIFWYRFTRVIRIPYIAVSSSLRNYLISGFALNGIFLGASGIGLLLWNWDVSFFILLSVAIYMLLLILVTHSFVEQYRDLKAKILFSLSFSVSASCFAIAMYILQILGVIDGSLFILIRDIALLLFAVSTFVLYGLISGMQLLKKRE